ncbi:hypothetical protein [Blastococcus sp. CT_GayMR19]|uniref:hypothetical protein n=1 Tax=Blastococcus sp. CT_GayMR19 TaxID=2559608 RepID=UPI00142FF1CE|nr:hypothetical protein [Blastococcus sp. CT_GayMR19]
MADRSAAAGHALPPHGPPAGAAPPVWPAQAGWQGGPAGLGGNAPFSGGRPGGGAPAAPPAGHPYGAMQPPAPAAKPAKHAAPWATGLSATPPSAAAPPSAATHPSAAMPVGYPGPAVPPPPAPSRRGPAGSGGRRMLIAAVVLCLVAAGIGVAWYLQRPQGIEDDASSVAFGAPLSEAAPGPGDADAAQEADGNASASASATPSRSSATTTPAGPTVTPEQQALVELETLRTESLPRLVLDGRWVAQVASKSVGITDPLQSAANGTHTFYAVDILAESRAAVASVSDSSVLVLRSTDFGKRSVAADGQAYWITLVDVGFTSSDQVKSWCASTYPTLTAEQLANACAARTLTSPHD